jgi:hypothetical protein
MRGLFMNSASDFFVKLSAMQFGCLCAIAAELEVPLEWLVAGMVCDTIECFPDKTAKPAVPLLAAKTCAGHRA